MDIKAFKTQILSRLIQDQRAECIGFIINSVIHAFVCADKIYLKPCIQMPSKRHLNFFPVTPGDFREEPSLAYFCALA